MKSRAFETAVLLMLILILARLDIGAFESIIILLALLAYALEGDGKNE